MDRYENFLYFIGAMFVPLFGVVLTDYFLLRRRQLNLEALFEHEGEYGYRRGFNVMALVSWGLGFGVYKLIELLQIPTGGTLPSILLTGLCYYALSKRRR